jgi:uncharacterized protein
MKPVRKGGFLDTNVLLRFLLDDDLTQSPLSCTFFKRLEDGTESVELEDVVLAESVWVLEKGYRVPRNEISRLLSCVISLKGVGCHGKRIVLEALSRYSSTSCDIVDCLLAARARSKGSKVISFDADFKKLQCEWMPPSSCVL